MDTEGVGGRKQEGPSTASSRAGPAHSQDPGQETQRTISEIKKRPFFPAILLTSLPWEEGILPVECCCTVISRPVFLNFEGRKVCQGSENASHSPDSPDCLDVVLIASETVL